MRHAVDSRLGILRSNRIGLRGHNDTTADDDEHNYDDNYDDNNDDNNDKHDNNYAGPDDYDDVPAERLLHH